MNWPSLEKYPTIGRVLAEELIWVWNCRPSPTQLVFQPNCKDGALLGVHQGHRIALLPMIFNKISRWPEQVVNWFEYLLAFTVVWAKIQFPKCCLPRSSACLKSLFCCTCWLDNMCSQDCRNGIRPAKVTNYSWERVKKVQAFSWRISLNNSLWWRRWVPLIIRVKASCALCRSQSRAVDMTHPS